MTPLAHRRYRSAHAPISAHMPTKQRGYTVVELMISLAIFAIGATGVLAMQIVASQANTHAKDIAVATQLARSWQDNLAMDALLWGGPQSWGIANTRWVTQVGVQNNIWFTPVSNVDGTFGPAADARGQYVNQITDPEGVVFCTHVRLTQLLPTAGIQLLRSEVRVFWPKGEVSYNTGADYCTANAADIAAIGAATTQFHFVYHTSAIRQTPGF